MDFLSIIFFIVVGFYLFGWIVRLLLRWYLLRMARKMEQGGGAYRGFTWGSGGFQSWNSNAPQGDANPKKEGEVRVEQKARTEKRVNKQVGEYVDYEEVEEQKSDKNEL